MASAKTPRARLATWVKAQGTQEQAGKSLGITQGHVSAVLKGRKVPSLQVAVNIERATGGAIRASEWVQRPRRRRRSASNIKAVTTGAA